MCMMYEWVMNIMQALKYELNSLYTKSKGWGASGRITYFNSTRFAVYNGVSHDYKNTTIMEQLDVQ